MSATPHGITPRDFSGMLDPFFDNADDLLMIPKVIAQADRRLALPTLFLNKNNAWDILFHVLACKHEIRKNTDVFRTALNGLPDRR